METRDGRWGWGIEPCTVGFGGDDVPQLFQVWGAGTVDVLWKLYAKRVEYVR